MKKILPILVFIPILFAAEDPRDSRQTPLMKSVIHEWKFFDINSIYCTINSAGPYADYLRTNSSGLFWPKGSFQTAVYTSGIWIVGKHKPTGNLRTAVQQYLTEFQPGTINGIYNTSTNDLSAASDPNSTRHRIYKINKGDKASTNPDYEEWPGDLGAPFNDVNGNGRWDKGTDTPKLIGDQTLWTVYNDLDTALHRKVGTTLPMGIEVHAMYYGFKTPGPLENTMFVQWKIINKSDAQYDSVFIGMWSDIDMGDANDDVDGYDTTLSLAYVYNGDNDDQGSSGYGTKPPACGTMFLGGHPEIVPYAYPVYIKSQDPYGDLRMGNPVFPMDAFNYLRGLTKTTGVPNIDPITNLPSRFAFTGDPITNIGWTRSASGFSPADVRSLLSLGPITLAPGDTQEVNAAFVIAQGHDRLQSVRQLRDYVFNIRLGFEKQFQFPISTIHSFIRSDSVELQISVNGNPVNANSISIDVIRESDDSLLLTKTLFDNGVLGDNVAGDGVYSGLITLAVSPTSVRLNSRITDRDNSTTHWPRIAGNIPLSKLSVTDPVIYSDNGNQDGKIQPGENIRYGVKIVNPHPIPFGSVDIIRTNENYFPLIQMNVNAQSINEVKYAASVRSTYLSFTLPSNFSGSTHTEYITVIDLNGNQWKDSIVFPIHTVMKRITSPARISGRSPFTIDVDVVNNNIVSDHMYIVRGVDSSNKLLGIEIKDSSTNNLVAPIISLNQFTDIQSLNHLIPQTDGFKVNVSTFQYFSSVEQKVLPADTMQWFSALIYTPVYYIQPLSSVHYGVVPDVMLKFSAAIPFFVDMSFGTFTAGSTYSYAQWGNKRHQKAFLYSRTDKYIGFIDVPFTAYDISADPPRQLTIVLHRATSASVSKTWNVDTDVLYVMSDQYNVDGILYDSTKGGQNLLPQFGTAGSIPYFYFIKLKTEHAPINDTTEFIITYTPALSSQDVFIIKPANYSIELTHPATIPELFQNYPNPFNPTTIIQYSLPFRSLVLINIYNILGQKVRTLLNENREAGTYEIEWNGRDDNNIPVASGVYLYRFSNEGTNIVRKMMMIK